MEYLRIIFILWMLSNMTIIAKCDYEGHRAGEEVDPAGQDDEDLSVVLKDGEESVETEKEIDKKLKNLDKLRPNDESLKMEVKIQAEQKEKEEQAEGKSKRSTGIRNRFKRYMVDETRWEWIKAIIPYVIRDANLPVSHRDSIKKAITLYERYTCFRFVEWDNNTKTTYGLDHNNYLNFVKGSGCWSFLGNLRKKTGGQPISCCTGSVCVHEIGHAIGFYHEQQSPLSKDLLRVNTQNIQEKYVSQYRRSSYSKNLDKFPYDLNSVMHYGLWTFNNGKGETMTVFDPKLKYLIGKRDLEYFYFFKEMTTVYKCTELKCPNVELKCENTGYPAYVDNKCQCRCPKNLDPATGCKTIQQKKLNETLKWPSSKFAFLRPANTTCPKESIEGSFTRKSDGGFTNDNYLAMGDYENLHFCTFNDASRSGEANLWPTGEYCLTRAGGACPKQGCPFGWTFNKDTNHCYKAFKDPVNGYQEGVNLCRDHKSYIVNIQNQAENNFVKTLISSNSYIGLTDMKKEGVFVWSNGQELTYKNWNWRQPDNWRGNEDCTLMYRWGRWGDVGCWYRLPVVCEMSLPGFESGSIEFEDDSVTTKGTLPDVLSGGKTKLEFCCRNEGNIGYPIVFTTASKFILWQTNKLGCQEVKDTFAISNHFVVRMKSGKSAKISGTTPLSYKKDNLVYVYFCVYEPVSTDCGKVIELTDDNPTAVVTSPYFPKSYHSNMECTWLIKSKTNSRIVLSFEEFEIPKMSDKCDDFLEVRTSLPSQPGIWYCGHEFKTSVYSVKNYMNLILYSKSYQHGKRFKGTAKMIKDEDLCYYAPDKGVSYRGGVNFSRNFKACLPWNETTHCVHSTNNTADDLSGLDSNFCRNPKSGTEPWCYIESKGCIRDYCDVCGVGNCHDFDPNCAEILKKNPDYCRSPATWNGVVKCAKTCGFCEKQTKKKYAELKCEKPQIPKGTTGVNPGANDAQVGKSLRYFYPTNNFSLFSVMCLSDGSWSKPYDCPEGWILNSDTNKCNIVIVQKFTGRYAGDMICRQYLGYVAQIKDAAENNFLYKMVKKAMKDALIDISDKLEEKKWTLSNGEKAMYLNWNGNEPNNWRNEDCAVMKTNGRYNDIDCQAYFSAVVCQMSLPVNSCPDGSLNCEKFEKLKNVAEGKSVKQSSTYPPFKAEFAVDGKLTGMSHTRNDKTPWWQVDLGRVFPVRKILIVNRMKSWGSRLRNLKVTIGETENNMKECVFYEGPGESSEYIELKCTTPLSGQFVKLQMTTAGFLQLTEVYVFTKA